MGVGGEEDARAKDAQYRSTSLISNRPRLGPYSRPMPRALQGYLVYKKTLLKKPHRVLPLRFLNVKKIGPTGCFSAFIFLRKHRPTGFSGFLMD